MTEIQKDSLQFSLRGRDILGAAKTGSGKTLAFLVAVLECLYRKRWTKMDGLGAVILTPTRELALQIFEVLRKIGKKHSLSAGLIIGGKDLRLEQERIGGMNILICTPGRLLQHLDQTSDFSTDNLQMLVLDEADRILDMGFAKTVNAILESLPKERQTLLFSATQTSSVKDLARLSLKNPEYVAVHDKAEHATPQQLVQYYTTCPLPSKMDFLFSFVRKHLDKKILVFVSSCKQVRFIYESFKLLRPGTPVMPLFGKQKQLKRMAIFNDFCQKKAAVLVATDIAARGLDFPKVDWVLQVDTPEDVATYIHRVGRTARYESAGSALLFLLPSEEAFVPLLQAKKIPIEPIKFSKLAKVQPIGQKLMAFCAQSAELKYLAQKSLISYVRSVYLQSNKAVFKVQELPIEEYSSAIGLPGCPKMKFAEKNNNKNISRQFQQPEESKQDDSEDESVESISQKDSEDESKEAEEEMDEFLTIKRSIDEVDLDEIKPNIPVKISRRDLLKSKKKYRLKSNESSKRFVYDEEGNAQPAFPYDTEVDLKKSDINKEFEEHKEHALMEMQEQDVMDKEREKEKKREKKMEKRRKLNEEKQGK